MQRSELCVAVTGVGSFSSIGKNAAEMLESLRSGRCGVGEIKLFDTTGLKVRHAAETDYDASAYFSPEEVNSFDRTTQFGIIAAREAIADSKLDLSQIPGDRIGLIVGVCSGSSEQLPAEDRMVDDETIRKMLDRVRHCQTVDLAKTLNIHGVQASVSTACASSSTALAYAFELLQGGRADVVLVGGADILHYIAYVGFYALGAMATQPCSPFSTNVGASFGEGAGFVVLESLEHAKRRNAHIYGEVAGYGCTSDAYHITSPHPSGEGLRRAMEAALRRADATVEDITYVNGHGTGTRDNDTAESLALTDLCAGKRIPPPMSSTKAMMGHTLGAAGILEFISCLLSAQEGFLPPTVNYTEARPGCDLDYVPNKSRKAEIDLFLSNSAAFGGVNTVIAGRKNPVPAKRPREISRIVISGIGVVSSAGCGISEFRRALSANKPAFQKVDRFDVNDCAIQVAAAVKNFKPRQLTPTLDVRRLDLLNQYAAVSAGLAYTDACLTTRPVNPERIGSVIAMAGGPLATGEAFQKNLQEQGVEGVSAKYFPAIVLSTLGGQVCQTLSLKGINTTVLDGIGAGLPAAIHAYEMLRASDKEDQIVVVAPDEMSRWLFKSLDYCGLLSDESNPYSADSKGFVFGEGSVALVIERLESAQERGAKIYAEILGFGATCNSTALFDQTVDPSWMETSMKTALRDAGTTADEIDFAVGLGHGRVAYDLAERAAFDAVLGDSVGISLPSSLLGMGLASSGAAALAVGALGLADHQLYTPAPGRNNAPEAFRKALVFGSSQTGNHSAMVLGVLG